MSLKQLRIHNGYLIEFIAQKLNITVRHFRRIENGEGYLTKERAKELSKLYKVCENQIFKSYKESKNGRVN